VKKANRKYIIDVCSECKVRENDSSKKKLFKCRFCERYFCKKHLAPRLAMMRSAIEEIKDPVLRDKVYEEWRKKDGHPDWAWTEKYFEKIKIEEERKRERFWEAVERLKEISEEKEKKEIPSSILYTPFPEKIEKVVKLSFPKKSLIILIIAVGILLSLLAITIHKNFEIGNELSFIENKLYNLQEEKDNLTQKSKSLDWAINTIQAKLNSTKEKLGEVNSLIQIMKSNKKYKLHDPTYYEVKSFLEKDQTDKNIYSENYTCAYFSRDVNNNAEESGIRTAFVELEFPAGVPGHAIIAFNTTDKGLVYFEPQYDVEVRPEIGKRYFECLEEIPGYYWVGPEYNDTIVDVFIWW